MNNKKWAKLDIINNRECYIIKLWDNDTNEYTIGYIYYFVHAQEYPESEAKYLTYKIVNKILELIQLGYTFKFTEV